MEIPMRAARQPALTLAALSAVRSRRSASSAAQGPPYQTDDPVPVDLHHYEFYIFGGVDGTPAEMDSTGPAFEFNWGAIPRVQLHAILPWGVVAPSNNPVYLPGGTGPTHFGLTDMELGAKIAFIKETKHIPQIGTFTMFEMPTGNYDKGLGVGKVWYKLPIWLQKNYGKWLFDGGGGYEVVPQTGYRDFPYTGWLVKRELSEQWELGAEVFAHGSEGFAAAQTQASTMIDVGGYYHFKHNHQRAVPLLLRPLRRRADRELRLRGHVLDLGQGREERPPDDKKDAAVQRAFPRPPNRNGRSSTLDRCRTALHAARAERTVIHGNHDTRSLDNDSRHGIRRALSPGLLRRARRALPPLSLADRRRRSPSATRRFLGIYLDSDGRARVADRAHRRLHHLSLVPRRAAAGHGKPRRISAAAAHVESRRPSPGTPSAWSGRSTWPGSCPSPSPWLRRFSLGMGAI